MLRILCILVASWGLWQTAGYCWQQTYPDAYSTAAPHSPTEAHDHDQDHAHHHHHDHGDHVHDHGAHTHHHHDHGHGKGLDCGFDELHKRLLEQRPALRQRARETELRWRDGLEFGQGFNATGGTHTVPVVVHIVHNNGPSNISDARVQTAIQYLNDAFGNVGYYNPATGVDTEIQFCLASRDTLGNPTTGITRTVSPLTQLDKNTQDLALKNLSRWNPNDYINIWVVDEILGGTAGYAYFPSAHGTNIDGIVLEWSYMGNTEAETSVLVHEMGHYFGLYHTFEGGCTNSDCTAQGDKVCDTPPDNTTARPPCGTVLNSCTSDEDDTSTNNPFRAIALGGQGDQPDEKENYMDYSEFACYDRFSQGQADRMQFFLHGDRMSLLQSQVCSPPCTTPIQFGFTASGLTTTAGTPLTFTDTSVNSSATQWLVDGVSVGTATVLSYNFPAAGTYWVRLVASNGDPNCTQTDSIQITVFCAPPCGEVCDNGIDDDGNGLIDCYDPACDCNPCSDKRANRWYFGSRAVLDFNSGTPVAGGVSRLSTSEGSTSMCDPNGNLLFYTDGETVWNRNHQVMANGANLFGNSSLSQIIVVPKPDDPAIFYLFVPDLQLNSRGLSYSEIDMRLNNNLGAVTQRNVLLNTNKTTEHITAIKHCNNKDFWVIVKEFRTNTYKIFPITSAGVSTTPLTQNIGRVHMDIGLNPGSSENAIGTMSASFLGDNMAITYRIDRGVELFDFDNTTGVLSNARYMTNSAWALPYGLEFSPSGEFLYCSTIGGWDIYQFDITLPTAPAILGSTYRVSRDSRGGNIQIGSDGKIYKAQNASGTLDVIEFPDLQGAACGYVNNAVNLAGRTSGLGMPSFIKEYTTTPIISYLTGPTAICNTNSASVERYTISDVTCNVDTVIWRHSGPNSIQSATDSLLLLNAAISGTDTLWATIISPCTTKTDQLIIRTIIAPQIDLGPDTSVCQNGVVSFNLGSGYQSCQWQDGTRDSIFTAFETGWYWAECTTFCGDTYRDSVYVTISTVPLLSYPDTTINVGDTARFTLQTSTGYQHEWTPIGGLSCTNCPLPLFYPDSTTTYYHIYTNALGCVGLDTVVVQVVNNCNPQVRLDSINNPCQGEMDGSIYITGTNGVSPFQYQWSTGDTTASLTGLAGGSQLYRVTLTDAAGCTAIDSFVVTAAPTPTATITIQVQPNCSLSNGVVVAAGANGNAPYTYLWDTGLQTDTLRNLAPGRYSVTVTSADGCSAVADAILIDIPGPPVVFVDNVSDTCAKGTGRLEIQPMSVNIPYTYVWSSGDTGLVADNLSAGVYTVTATSAAGCVSTGTDTVANIATSTLTLSINQVGANTAAVTQGANFSLLTDVAPPVTNGNYQWLVQNLSGTGIALNSLTGATNTGTATDTGAYEIQVVLTTPDGCTVSDSVLLYVRTNYLGMPDAFTPNGDNINDVFYPVGLPPQALNFFRIYDRWGEVIFDSPGGSVGWDGTSNGAEAPTEVYLYYLQYQLPGEPVVELRGSVTLLR